MPNEICNIKKPEIKKGTVVEIFACGGQCRGKNSSVTHTIDTNDIKLVYKKEKIS